MFNELFVQRLKAELGATFKFRHKYVAVVQLDGDGVGAAISHLQQNNRTFEDFSAALAAYSDAAVKMIIDYGGTPIYAGGDDVLFLAPVAVPHNQEIKDILTLCARLDQLFFATMNDATLSLSGGVFVGYYKYPLGEAVAQAADLEKQAKKFEVSFSEDAPAGGNPPPRHRKNALKLMVRKHSGQTFGATFRLRSASFSELTDLLNFDEALEAAFLTSAMRRLQSSPRLLAEVARSGDPQRLQAYRKHQFGKGGRHEGAYLDHALRYAMAVFAAYGDGQPEAENTNRIFAALRFHQFLIQADHD